MSTSIRRAALEDLATALGNISVANGYSTNITEIARRAFEWESVHQDYNLPVIGIVPGKVIYDYRASSNVIVATQTVSLEFCYAASNQTEAWDVGDQIIDDIIGAIHVDPSRGGNALHTMVKDAETDAGNPDIMDSREGTAAGIVTIEIMFNRGWSVSP